MLSSTGTTARQVARFCVTKLLLVFASITCTVASAEEVAQIALVQPALTPAAVELPTLWLKMAQDQKVAFSGQINYDTPTGKGVAMMYPAPSFVGFLAAVATHGALSTAQRSHEQDAMRTRADKVLTNYQPLLDEFTPAELATTSLAMMRKPDKRLISNTSSPIGPHDITIEVQPQFIITQDQRAIILENAISIFVAGNAKPYRTQIRVVSDDIGPDAFPKTWIDDQGRKLKEASGRLLATSLELALDSLQPASKEDVPQKTMRFQEGGKERIERGQLVREDCDRIFFKSLRDELISAPKKNNNCTDVK